MQGKEKAFNWNGRIFWQIRRLTSLAPLNGGKGYMDDCSEKSATGSSLFSVE